VGSQLMFRTVEVVFTSFMVPALLVPPVWVVARIWSRRHVAADAARELATQWRLLSGLFLLWLLLCVAVALQLPLGRMGTAAVVSCWVLYVGTNLAVAWHFLRFTARYGAIPAGVVADSAFARFLVVCLAQPVITAAAFIVLNAAMGVTWTGEVPALPVIQEGI